MFVRTIHLFNLLQIGWLIKSRAKLQKYGQTNKVACLALTRQRST